MLKGKNIATTYSNNFGQMESSDSGSDYTVNQAELK